MLWFLVVVSCKKVEPAPPELDDLLHQIWQKYDDGTDEVLAAAAVDLDGVLDGASLTEAFDGTVSRLSREEAAVVGVTNRDPARAVGVFLVNVFDCDPVQLEEILSYPDQSELYLDVYDAYSRTFDTPLEGWLAGEEQRVDYDVAYTADVLGAVYEANARGALRRVPESGLGPFVVQRSYLPEPGAFEDAGTNKSMDQDYQLEVYWTSGGHIVHAYAMWREASFGTGFDMESTSSQRILLNNLLDWDEDTAALCAEGRP